MGKLEILFLIVIWLIFLVIFYECLYFLFDGIFKYNICFLVYFYFNIKFFCNISKILIFFRLKNENIVYLKKRIFYNIIKFL